MNAHTPSISVVDPRGLALRAVAYCRKAVADPVTARVTHQVFDPVGRLSQQRDPRLFAFSQSDASIPANLTTIHNLSGQPLCSDSVDAGWQVDLPGPAGQVIESWDQRGWHRRSEHDPLLRPVAVHEQIRDEPERCVERMTFGGVSEDHARHNRCGQPIRQDDPAGSRLMADYGLSAVVLRESRQFLGTFDPVDWPVQDIDRDNLLEPGDGAQSLWTYAPTGEVLKQTDAQGHTRHFTYDRAGQLHSVGLQRAGQSTADTLVNAIEYNAFGQIEQERAGNGMRTSSSYDPANGRLTNLDTQGPAQGFLQKLSYGYDPVGNISEIADAALPIQYFANQRIEPVRRFTYDTLYQLISATGWETAKPSLGPALPDWQGFGPPDASRWCNYTETYYYDEAGNLLQRLHHGAVDDTLIMRVASHSNRSVKDRAGQPAIDELFDARGNLLVLEPGQTLNWNGRNQLTQVTQVARLDDVDDQERYVYDGQGMRLRKWRTVAAKSVVNTCEVRYLPGIELHVNSATGERLQVISVQAGRCSVRLLHWDSPPPAGLDNDQWRYCFDDHLGSSAFEVDAQAKTISQEVYYPFGGTAWLAGRHEVETSYKTIRYSGKERDATGLYYYGARYYAPWLQRWLNPDPAADVDGLNFYRFVRNGPVVYIDQDGHAPDPVSAHRTYIEQASGVSGRILLRGMINIRKHLPEMADKLRGAFAEAKQVVRHVGNILESGQYDRGLAGTYFGEVDSGVVSNLITHYRQLLGNIENIEVKPERLVIFNDPNGDTACVNFDDQEKYIYINYSVTSQQDPRFFLRVILHELSHQVNIFGEVDDYWYLSFPSDRLAYEKQSSGMLGAMEAKSKRMMVDVAVSDEDFAPSSSQDRLVYVSGVNNMSDALTRFKTSSKLRTQMAIRNADSLAAYAIAESQTTKFLGSQSSAQRFKHTARR
jgi:insecticidal toxin complex protein TccC